jgi:hypothetical protein
MLGLYTDVEQRNHCNHANSATVEMDLDFFAFEDRCDTLSGSISVCVFVCAICSKDENNTLGCRQALSASALKPSRATNIHASVISEVPSEGLNLMMSVQPP